MDNDLKKDIFTECRMYLQRVKNSLGAVDKEKFEDEIETINEVIDEMSEQILVIDIAENNFDQFKNEQKKARQTVSN